MTRRLLLDTSSLMYRSFFSHPTTMRNARGKPINAVYGYLDMVAYLVAARRPTEIVSVYDDDWRPAARVALYSRYKANRAPDPEGLPWQFDLLREVLDAFGLPQADAPGWEAEDAIGVLCARPNAPPSDIVTGDRDLIQLVRDPDVRVLFTLRGVREVAVYDEAGVQAKYGVSPARYVDFAILRGDPSDGLPGVAGVGEKTARALVSAYPSLGALVKDAGASRRTQPVLQRSPRLRASLQASLAYLETMQRLVPIRTDVEARTWTAEPNPDHLQSLAEQHKLLGPVRRLTHALAAAGS